MPRYLHSDEGWTYLGDGLYWRIRPGLLDIEVVAFNGREVYNSIVMEPEALDRLKKETDAKYNAMIRPSLTMGGEIGDLPSYNSPAREGVEI